MNDRTEAQHRLDHGAEFPYDAPDAWWEMAEPKPLPATDWAHAAARGILADLTDRRGIKWSLQEIDEEVRAELVASLAEIIRAALAQQDEPVEEPVDVGLLEYRGNSVAFIHQKMTAYRAGIDAAWDALRAKGLHPDGKTSLANMIAKYTAPSQRKPLTVEEIVRIIDDNLEGGSSLVDIARAIERAHGIKENGND